MSCHSISENGIVPVVVLIMTVMAMLEHQEGIRYCKVMAEGTPSLLMRLCKTTVGKGAAVNEVKPTLYRLRSVLGGFTSDPQPQDSQKNPGTDRG